MLRDSKYLLAYILPLTAFVSLYVGGIWSFFSLMFGFILIPFLDGFFKGTDENLSEEQEENKLANRFFDIMLYLNVPILYALLIYYFSLVASGGFEIYELIGFTMSVGLIIGSTGINVAHELGHRTTKFEQFLSKMLLLPNHYLHFFIEHNRGHHKNVATPEDPATSRLNESVYAFWIRSVFGCYKGAWKLENTRLRKAGKAVFSLENEMLR
jgi:alkane 1-monooxygenase